MQCKEIPDSAVLDFLRTRPRGSPAFAFGPEICGEDSIFNAFPAAPRKVMMAKLRRLIERKMIRGCVCGCRGDFELPLGDHPQDGVGLDD